MAAFAAAKVLISLSGVFLLASPPGICMQQPGACRPYCSGSDCITLHTKRVDFRAAEEACRHTNGELVTFDKNISDVLTRDLTGSVWIGLRLPAGACSNVSAPLRGYRWTSGGGHAGFIPPPGTWEAGAQVCSPRCVSLSHRRTWAERPCSEESDGFLCRTRRGDACRAQAVSGPAVSGPAVFQSSESCSDGPCEHECTDVKGGYMCSCFKGFVPDSKEPRRCKIHCSQQKCPTVCDRDTGRACLCPHGFIITQSDTLCLDINECSSGECEQECKNTFGSFVCSCRDGFALKDGFRCIPAPPAVVEVIKPASNSSGGGGTPAGSSAATAGFLWVWLCVAVAVVALILAIRFYVVKRQKHRENVTQLSAAPRDNIEC